MLNWKLILISIFVIFFAGCSQSGSISIDNYILTQDFLNEVALGNVDGAYVVHKFGANDGVGTTITPISIGGFYRTPTSATSLEVLSNNANDDIAGIGARTLRIIGLNASGDEIYEDVNLSGVTPVALSNQFLRVYRWYVLESGTYATQTAPSQYGTITLRESGGGQTWSNLNVIGGGFGVGQSEIGVYSVPKGNTCWLLKKVMSVNSNKYANIYFFKRENLTDTTAPYSAIRLVEKHIGVTSVTTLESRSAIDKFKELTDIGFMANTDTGSAEVSVEFEMICLNNQIFNITYS